MKPNLHEANEVAEPPWVRLYGSRLDTRSKDSLHIQEQSEGRLLRPDYHCAEEAAVMLSIMVSVSGEVPRCRRGGAGRGNTPTDPICGAQLCSTSFCHRRSATGKCPAEMVG